VISLYKYSIMQRSVYTSIEKMTNIIIGSEPEGTGLFDGKGSKVIYYYELFRATGRGADKARLDEAGKELSAELALVAGEADCSLASGLSGLMWLFYQLREDGLMREPGYLNADIISEQIASSAMLFIDSHKTGYIEGAYGMLYSLLLGEQTMRVKQHVAGILEKITSGYTPGDLYSTFSLHNTILPGKQELDLGFLHGLSGNLLVLIKACQLGYNKQNNLVEKLLNEGVKFILHHKMDVDYEDDCFSFFPSVVKKNRDFVESSNTLAWFNSDLNHLLLLYEMHLLTGDRHYKEMADYIGLQTIARKQFDETLVDNSSFINGSSGVAMFYKKLSVYSNTREYLDAFHYWTERTMVHLDEDIEKETYAAPGQVGVLNGLIGVSLTLLAGSHDNTAPKWTKLFFL
jgi:lantibiotic biosynthesis protein